MSEHAVWRRSPGDPRTALGWALADAPRVFVAARQGLSCLGVVGAAFLLFAGHAASASALLLGTGVLNAVGRRRSRSVEPLLTLPPNAPTFPCAIEATREGVAVGVDRGIVTFVEGWLCFEGFRTAFALSRRDVAKRAENVLTFDDGTGVLFEPDESFRAPGIDRNAQHVAFGDELDRWYRLAPAAKGRSIRPPRAVHPSGVARAWTDLLGSLVRSGLISTALLYAIFALHGSLWLLAFGGLTGSVGGGVLHLRKLRRFVREDRTLPNERRVPLVP